ncbi:MAG: (Fe-S)-binding protein [Desulfobacteraceae bacterium]|jgi:Fe-S oxidoreductase|nr:MAG: (Fe-S)-binding protein [Desulfobacteraceae bacterium]
MWNAEKCTLCGDCLVECQYTDYGREDAVAQIELLTKGGKPSILKECVTCCACNEYCPTGANPFDRINELQEKHGSLPIPPKMRQFMDAGATVPSSLIKGDPSRPALSLCVMERPLPRDAVGGKMFDGMTIAKGGDYFCYLGYVHIGMETPLKENAQKFIDSIKSLQNPEVVFLHADCHAMIARMPEYGIDVPFKAVHIIEYVRDYLRKHPGEISPVGKKIAYQRPCASRYSTQVEPALDELFELAGVERVTRKYDRESALCCGGLFSRINPERINPLMEANLKDAKDAGAEAMVFLCPLCMVTLGAKALEKEMKPIFITQLARMALGEIPYPA